MYNKNKEKLNAEACVCVVCVGEGVGKAKGGGGIVFSNLTAARNKHGICISSASPFAL